MRKNDMVGRAGALRLLLLTIMSAIAVSCSGETSRGTGSDGQSPETANAPPTDFVSGVKLASVSLSPTHSVEFWETEPGTILAIQRLDTAGGETPLELGPAFRSAGGTYGGLYRKLAKEPQAVLSPELVAADERLSKSPIRDASLPAPPGVRSPLPPAAFGPAYRSPDAAPPSAAPTTLVPLGLRTGLGGGQINAPYINSTFCSDAEVDGGWCQVGSYYGFMYGNTQEVMFLSQVAYNPQAKGSGNDQFTLTRFLPSGSSSTDVSMSLAPGQLITVMYIGTAATYQGAITGYIVAYEEKWRLSFPTLSYSYSDPGWGEGNSFSNNIEGLTHGYNIAPLSESQNPTNSLWFESRTEFSGSTSVHGQIGIQASLGSVYGPDPWCTFDEPGTWHNSPNYAHYGDIVYEKARVPTATDRSGSGFLIVSLNAADNTHAGVGFLGVSPAPSTDCGYTLQDWGTVLLSATEQAPCVALTHKFSGTYAYGVYEGPTIAHVYVPASDGWNYLHEYTIDFSGNPFIANTERVFIVNANSVQVPVTATTGVGGPNGMKVSRHGKLYMWSVQTENKVGVLYGIDPFSGMIQVQLPLNYGSPGTFTGYQNKIESEGLDIIDSSEVNFTAPAPEILVQSLADSPNTTLFGDSQWTAMRINVSDASRL